MKMPPQLVVAPCPICGTPIEVEVDFSTEYKRIRHTPGSDSAKVFGSIAEVRLIPAVDSTPIKDHIFQEHKEYAS